MLKKFEQFNSNDPYGEEIWDEKEIQDYSHEAGRCINCGSYNLDYFDSEQDGMNFWYVYTCEDCGADG